MKYINMVLFILFLTVIGLSSKTKCNGTLIIHSVLGYPEMPNFSKWRVVKLFNDDHSGETPVPPPSLWTNLTIPIENGATEVQLIGIYRGFAINITTERVAYACANNTDLDVSLVWWGFPWILLVGWKFN